MALAVIDSDTQTATLTTEHTLVTDTTGKTYVLCVDTAALVNGETLELRIYTKTLSGGTERLAYMATYVNVQQEPIKYSVPVPADISFKATLEQNGGTGRAFPWSVLSLD
jgi:hypothetical protein